ncbi:hypothetical protein GTY63_38555 [Amycolatopsis rubida]|nr:hypothetical protein [Amycolatopsis rubida]
MAGDPAAWDGTGLTASGTEELFGATTTVALALRASAGFVVHDNGYSGAASDCLVDLRGHRTLANQFDFADYGNVVQCGQMPVERGTTWGHAVGRRRERRRAQRRVPPRVGPGPVPAEDRTARDGRRGAGEADGAVPVVRAVDFRVHPRRRDDVPGRRVSALQPGERGPRGHAAATRLVRAAGPGFRRAHSRWDDRGSPTRRRTRGSR